MTRRHETQRDLGRAVSPPTREGRSAEDARPKVVAAIVMVVCAAAAHRAAFPLALIPLMAGATYRAGVPVRRILLRMIPAIALAIVLLILHAFVAGATPLAQLSVFGWTITATREGASRGLLLASRVLGGMSVVTYLSTTTQPQELFRALRWMHVPSTWIETASLTWRYVAMLMEVSASVSAAQRTRLGYSGFRRSLQSAGVLAGAVMTRSMEQALRTHEAMVLRAHGALPLVYREPLNAPQWGTMLLASAIPVVLLSVIEHIAGCP